MIFLDQLKVPTIKFGKCFAELMIPIALLKKFGSCATIIEVSNMRRCSGKANKLRYVYTIRGRRGTSPSRNGNLTISKLKSSHLSYILVVVLYHYESIS